MKIIIAIGHPAHLHLFKNLYFRCLCEGHHCLFVATPKDILQILAEELNIPLIFIGVRKPNENLLNKFFKLLRSTFHLYKITRNYKPDVLIGCISQLVYTGWLLRKPTFFFAEDDFHYTRLQGLITYPLVTGIVSSEATDVGIFRYKKKEYKGYQKLAYLHPNYFTPEITRIKDYLDTGDPFFLIRIVKLQAYHDTNAQGLTEKIVLKLIEQISERGKIFITSEHELSDSLKKYQLKVPASLIHHLLFFAELLICDSQSMAVEAALLGTPSIRFNSFAGRINVLNELENKYGLTYAVHSSQPELLFKTVDELLEMQNRKTEFRRRREILLKNISDVNTFYFDLIQSAVKK